MPGQSTGDVRSSRERDEVSVTGDEARSVEEPDGWIIFSYGGEPGWYDCWANRLPAADCSDSSELRPRYGPRRARVVCGG